jgi:hypothetical protein
MMQGTKAKRLCDFFFAVLASYKSTEQHLGTDEIDTGRWPDG